MKRLLTRVLFTGTLLLTACGGVEPEPGQEPALDEVKQAIAPVSCGSNPNQIVIYYSNSTKTTEVGRRECLCDGTPLLYGQQTLYWSAVSSIHCP